MYRPGDREAATGGASEAQYLPGLCYYYGKGVEEDNEKAACWWTEAATRGDVAAQLQLQLGLRYYNGEGVARDMNEAVTWLEKAIGSGNLNKVARSLAEEKIKAAKSYRDEQGKGE
ncbi:MAG: hypothetical protein LBF09_06955 [Odoribacteraceae bacterium]|nr:hypothetical protein [Odoribacteraceae bacterium]